MRHSNRTLYRSRNGVIFGVFRGLSDSLGLSIFWLRAIFIVLLFLTGIFPLIPLYCLAALIMPLEPKEQLMDDEAEFYNSMTANRTLALKRLSSKLDSLDRRTRRMENVVTARGYDWDRRMREQS